MKQLYAGLGSIVLGSMLLFGSLSIWAQETDATQTPAAAPPPATLTGSGKAGYIPIWTSGTALGNSKLYQVGGDVGIATTAPKWALDVNGFINATKGYRINQYSILGLAGPANYYNLALGYLTFPANSFGTLDTAVGAYAMNAELSGNFETALGAFALADEQAGQNNTALGSYAMWANIDGSGNTAVGNFAMGGNKHGNNNIAIGYTAAHQVGDGNGNNIHIGSIGASGDNGVIRIGAPGSQTSFFVAGVSGVTTGLADAVPVLIDANGQLGTVSSSRRFKEDIQDMGDASHGLMQLRPVTFRYQKPFADGAKPLQYGLIAEEVAEVYPDLVAHSADGEIQTVKYQVLDSMLLNEVQRQQAEIRALEERLAKMEEALARASRPSDK